MGQTDLVGTFWFYLIGLLILFSIMAALADALEAMASRRARDQARAEDRAKRRRERGSFDF
jgi:hypothetical protein